MLGAGCGVLQCALSTQHSALSTQHSAPSTQHYSAIPLSFRILHTFSGVIGMSMWRHAEMRSASTTALTIAGGAPTVADSPTPLAPSGWCGDGVIVLSVSHFGVSIAVGTR